MPLSPALPHRSAFLLDDGKLPRFLVLSALLHLWLVLSIGTQPGPNETGQGGWGDLEVVTLGRGEPGPGQTTPTPPAPQAGPPGDAKTTRHGGRLRAPDPSTPNGPGAAQLGTWKPQELPPDPSRPDTDSAGTRGDGDRDLPAPPPAPTAPAPIAAPAPPTPSPPEAPAPAPVLALPQEALPAPRANRAAPLSERIAAPAPSPSAELQARPAAVELPTPSAEPEAEAEAEPVTPALRTLQMPSESGPRPALSARRSGPLTVPAARAASAPPAALVAPVAKGLPALATLVP
ncbi:hypothetical protein I7X39_20630, partial [Inhella sp. 1Y17]|nr:hypothetical protein [Inhella proteolytica]